MSQSRKSRRETSNTNSNGNMIDNRCIERKGSFNGGQTICKQTCDKSNKPLLEMYMHNMKHGKSSSKQKSKTYEKLNENFNKEKPTNDNSYYDSYSRQEDEKHERPCRLLKPTKNLDFNSDSYDDDKCSNYQRNEVNVAHFKLGKKNGEPNVDPYCDEKPLNCHRDDQNAPYYKSCKKNVMKEIKEEIKKSKEDETHLKYHQEMLNKNNFKVSESRSFTNFYDSKDIDSPLVVKCSQPSLVNSSEVYKRRMLPSKRIDNDFMLKQANINLISSTQYNKYGKNIKNHKPYCHQQVSNAYQRINPKYELERHSCTNLNNFEKELHTHVTCQKWKPPTPGPGLLKYQSRIESLVSSNVTTQEKNSIKSNRDNYSLKSNGNNVSCNSVGSCTVVNRDDKMSSINGTNLSQESERPKSRRLNFLDDPPYTNTMDFLGDENYRKIRQLFKFQDGCVGYLFTFNNRG